MPVDRPQDLVRARVQVDSVGATLADAEAVDAAVHGDGLGDGATGLSGWTGEVAGSPPFAIAQIAPLDARVLVDAEELNQVRVSRDYMVWFRP